MDNDLMLKYIENEYENEFLDFKLKPYNWQSQNAKSDFLTDVISLANSSSEGDKYIILGVKVKNNGTREIKGINSNDLVDSAEYQQLVTENIEPTISIELKIVTNSQGLNFGIIRIFNCNNRPYLLKKKYENLESGFIKVRKGSRNSNVSRYILDEIYNSKNPKKESVFKISGLMDGKTTDVVKVVKYDFFPNMETRKNKLINIFNKVNKFKIDDIVDQEETKFNLTDEKKSFYSAFLPTALKIEESVQKQIESFAKVFKLKISNTFFDLGNLVSQLNGMKSNSILGIVPEYKISGSKKSKEKYDLIEELNEKIMSTISWLKFLEETEKFGFIELAITEIGNISDEEIEVSIKMPKSNYVSEDAFPEPADDIIAELNEKYTEKMFKPYYLEDISDFRGTPSSPSYSNISSISGLVKNDNEIFDGPYNYIDYDVNYNNEFAILSFTIKNIKEKETMIFPGKILIRGEVNQLKYSIISKNLKTKVTGTINVGK